MLGLSTGSRPVVTETGRLVVPGLFVRDDFDRADADTLGDRWTDAASVWPDAFAPLGIRGGSVACVDPYAPDLTYTYQGEDFNGIGCAWRQFQTVDAQATVCWSGDTSPHTIEATPLLHVTPSSSKLGFGAWPSQSTPGAFGVGFVGNIGNPPYLFEVYAYWLYLFDRQPHTISMRSRSGSVRVFMDGAEVQLLRAGDNVPVTSVAVPAELSASSLHGFAVDTHFGPDPDAHCLDWVTIAQA